MAHLRMTSPSRMLFLSLPLLAACSGQTIGTFDPDLRRIGGGFNTADAARAVTQSRPQPDNRGVISYPSYQVAVAQSGDTVTTVASRVGVPPGDLARYNGLPPEAPLRAGEVVVLPRRVAEPSPATGAIATGPITPTAPVDITTMAGSAIDRAGGGTTATSTTTLPPPQTGSEPVRHQVKRGETAFTIARSYGVSVEALAEWNGLDNQFTVREGQYLMIPPVDRNRTAAVAPAASAVEPPGAGSATPTPPSAATPLPAANPTPTAEPASPNLAADRTAASGAARFAMPASGSIIRAFSKGKNDGIDIGAAAGSSVVAAEAGSVAAITTPTDGIPVLVIRHADGLLTVYTGIDQIAVKRGDSVRKGQKIAVVRAGNPSFVHFEVRRGMEALDPTPYLN